MRRPFGVPPGRVGGPGCLGYAFGIVSLDALLLVVAGAAVIARALFVAADAALGGVSPERAAELRERNDSFENRALLALKRDLEGTGFTTRGGAIAALALAAALAGAASLRLLGPAFDQLPLGELAAAAVGGAASTLAILVVDLVPRSLAVARPEPWAGRVALPVWLASRIVAPLGKAILGAVGRMLAPLGVKATFRSAPPALEDLERYLIDAREDEDAPDSELVHSLFEFSTRIAREVMVPRTEVAAVPIDITPACLVQLLAEKGHSRLPVYQGDIDHIVGVLHTREIVPLLAHPELIKLPDVIRPATFVPWATRVVRLLRVMQQQRIHMAMVTDEHGGFMGVVTLEDILEEIVGDIHDEFDEGETGEIETLADGSWRVDTGIAIPDFNDALGAALPDDEDFDTLAGFLNHLAGEIPERGATLHAHDLVFTVEDRTPRRVLSVRVTITRTRQVG